jgi:hypothetical protein
MLGLRKGEGERLAIPAMVILVGLAAFGLGRISVQVQVNEPASPTRHTYVGSKSGSVYYLSSCKGASAIKQENRVWFVSADDAEAAGYRPATGCVGL